jgi:hypothetical protein
MMYNNKLVVCIKVDGKVLRENKDLVQLPFGSEFTVLVKNLNSRRAKFTLNIDGQDVLDGEHIIVDANSEVEMKRFIRNGNMDTGNAFKFIERTQSIENGPRGIKVDDGVVRVEFWFEQEAPEIKTTYHRDVWWDEYHYPYRKSFWSPPFNGPYYSSASSTSGELSSVKLGAASTVTKSAVRSVAADSGGGEVFAQAMNASSTFSANAATGTATAYNSSLESSPPPAEVSFNEAGITVPGSRIEQKFHSVYGFKSESQSHVIVIRLVGRTGAINIAAPVTVKSKQKCGVCSYLNKASSKFCNQCGASLEIY